HPQHYRKLISHIFGRNKHSTKQIPATLWCCYYCRKHYQRARYRERDTWALTQCFWVGQMLQRLRTLPDLVGFRVQLRLRQQQHPPRPRPSPSPPVGAPMVPRWLVERITSRDNGEVWSFEETQALVGGEIREWLLELRARNVAAGEFPDVEILPVWR
ncbi:putative pathogenicity factor, partial [Aspergillus aculeatinus CBS 121060]